MSDDPFEGMVGSRPEGSDYWSDSEFETRSVVKEIPFYGSMLEQDLDDLFPHDFNRVERFKGKIVVSDPAVARLVLNALPSIYGYASGLEEGLRRLSQECTFELLRGACFLEIEYFREPNVIAPKAFMLHVVGAQELSRRHGQTVRYVPQSHSDLVHKGKHYVEVAPDDLVEIRLPRPQQKTLRKATRALRRAGAQHNVMYKMVTLDNSLPGFSVTQHQKIVDDYVRKSTRSLGWDGRQSLTGNNLEPYRVWREIVFAQFKVVVRDCILAGLEQAIRAAGSRVGFEASLAFEGLLSDTDLHQARLDLLSGDRSLYDISREVQLLPPKKP